MKCLHFKTRREIEAAESFQTFLKNIANMTLDEHVRQFTLFQLDIKKCRELRNTYSENLAGHQEDPAEYLRGLYDYQNRHRNRNVEEPSPADFRTCFDRVSSDNRVVQNFTIGTEDIMELSEDNHPNPSQFWLTLNACSIRSNNTGVTVNLSNAANARMEFGLGDTIDLYTEIHNLYIESLLRLPIPNSYLTKSAIEWSMRCRNLQIPRANRQQLLHILNTAAAADAEEGGRGLIMQIPQIEQPAYLLPPYAFISNQRFIRIPFSGAFTSD